MEHTEDHSYAKLGNAAIRVQTRGKAAAFLIKRLRKEKSVNITTHRKETPLIIAGQPGAARFQSLIVMRGADLDAHDEKGYTALHYAVESNSVKMVRHLVECGATVNIQNGDGNTPLHLVVNSNNCDNSNSCDCTNKNIYYSRKKDFACFVLVFFKFSLFRCFFETIDTFETIESNETFETFRKFLNF